MTDTPHTPQSAPPIDPVDAPRHLAKIRELQRAVDLARGAKAQARGAYYAAPMTWFEFESEFDSEF